MTAHFEGPWLTTHTKPGRRAHAIRALHGQAGLIGYQSWCGRSYPATTETRGVWPTHDPGTETCRTCDRMTGGNQ